MQLLQLRHAVARFGINRTSTGIAGNCFCCCLTEKQLSLIVADFRTAKRAFGCVLAVVVVSLCARINALTENA
ncbi:hypothetical protein D9M70_613000 [compost metagenome]